MECVNEKLWPVLIGILAGVFGYLFTTFFMQPVLRYRDIKNQVLMDFIYYAQVVNAKELNEDMQALFNQRVLANRKTSAQLSAAIQDLPWLYMGFIKLKGHRPTEAATLLIRYSNTTEYEEAHKIEAAIRRKLGLPKEA